MFQSLTKSIILLLWLFVNYSNMKTKDIIKDGRILARYIVGSNYNEGLSFYSNDNEFIQVGTWKYDKGKELSAHIHNKKNRIVQRTHEVIYVKKGSIEAHIYDLDKTLFETVILHEGDIMISLECGHGYKILEEGTEVLEIKSGPYLGSEQDRTRI